MIGRIFDNGENIGKTIGQPVTKSSLSRIFSTVVLSTFRLIVNEIANGFKSVKLSDGLSRSMTG